MTRSFKGALAKNLYQILWLRAGKVCQTGSTIEYEMWPSKNGHNKNAGQCSPSFLMTEVGDWDSHVQHMVANPAVSTQWSKNHPSPDLLPSMCAFYWRSVAGSCLRWPLVRPPSKAPMLIRSVADMCLVDHWSDTNPWEKVPTTRANQQCSHEHVRRACAAAVDHWSNILSHYDNIKVRLGWAKTSRWYLDKSDANLQWTVWIRERERAFSKSRQWQPLCGDLVNPLSLLHIQPFCSLHHSATHLCSAPSPEATIRDSAVREAFAKSPPERFSSRQRRVRLHFTRGFEKCKV